MRRLTLLSILVILPQLGLAVLGSPSGVETDTQMPSAGGAAVIEIPLDGVAQPLQQPSTDDGNEAFRQFRDALKSLNRRIVEAVGCDFFTDAEHLGEDTVKVTATRSWLATPVQYRETNLQKIFAIWCQANNGKRPLTVQVVDRQGELRMVLRMN